MAPANEPPPCAHTPHATMQDSLLETPTARPAPSSTSQLKTLLLRKELQLKLKRPICTLCELLLPIALSGLVVLGALAANEEHFPTTFYAPTSLASAWKTEVLRVAPFETDAFYDARQERCRARVRETSRCLTCASLGRSPLLRRACGG